MKKRSILQNTLLAIVGASLSLGSPVRADYDTMTQEMFGPRIEELSDSNPWFYEEKKDNKKVVFRWPDGEIRAHSAPHNQEPKIIPSQYHEVPEFKRYTGIPLFIQNENEDQEKTLISILDKLPESTKKQIKRLVIMPVEDFNRYKISSEESPEVGACTVNNNEIYFFTEPQVKYIAHEVAHVHHLNLDSIAKDNRPEEGKKAYPILEEILTEDNKSHFGKLSPEKRKFLEKEIEKIGKSPTERFEEEWKAVSHYDYGKGTIKLKGNGYLWDKPGIEEAEKAFEYTAQIRELDKNINVTKEYNKLDDLLAKRRKAFELYEDLLSPSEGMITPYASTGIKEDIAETVAAVYADPNTVRDLINPKSEKYDKRVKGKLDLLLKYEFIHQRDYDNINQSGEKNE